MLELRWKVLSKLLMRSMAGSLGRLDMNYSRLALPSSDFDRYRHAVQGSRARPLAAGHGTSSSRCGRWARTRMLKHTILEVSSWLESPSRI